MKQTGNNDPFTKPPSQYGCAVPACSDPGVWSPMVNGPTWYCRAHAGLQEPGPRWEPKPGPYTAEEVAEAKRKVKAFIASGKALLEPPGDAWWHRLITRWRAGDPLLLIQMQMVTQAWVNAGRPRDWMPPDEEDRLEREAIQGEGEVW